jgi:hypothetical protein
MVVVVVGVIVVVAVAVALVVARTGAVYYLDFLPY